VGIGFLAEIVHDVVIPSLPDNSPSIGISSAKLRYRFNAIDSQTATMGDFERDGGELSCKILPGQLPDGSSVISITAKTDKDDKVHYLSASINGDRLKGNTDGVIKFALVQWLDVVLFLNTSIQPGQTQVDPNKLVDSLGITAQEGQLNRRITVANVAYEFHKTGRNSELRISGLKGVDEVPNGDEVFQKKLKSLHFADAKGKSSVTSESENQ